jgi:hypothetical protein
MSKNVYCIGDEIKIKAIIENETNNEINGILISVIFISLIKKNKNKKVKIYLIF